MKLRIPVLVIALLLSVGTSAPANAGQQQWGAAYLDWSGAVLSANSAISQTIQPLELSPNTYWESGWSWGYGGIQTGNYLADGTLYTNAIFSIWDSLEAKPGEGSTCLVFGGEGIGHSCRIPIKIIAGNKYTFSVGVDKSRDSQWWKASITDESAGITKVLGSIKSNKANARSDMWNNFIEYFGEEVPCDKVGPATAKFYVPQSDNPKVEISNPRFSRPEKPCVMSAGDTPPPGTIGDAVIRFGGASQLPSTQNMPFKKSRAQLAAEKDAADKAEKDKSKEPIAVIQKPRKTAIVCAKGALTKKVVAIKPVCPKGYKKK